MAYNKETGMYEGYIYCITNQVDGKQYIGQTRVSIKERWRIHKRDSLKAHCRMYFHRALNKYGFDNFSIKTIYNSKFSNLSELKDDIDEKEKYYIKLYDTLCPNGYNVNPGGNSSNQSQEKTVLRYDLEDNFICKYNSLSDAARDNNLYVGDISNCCTGKIRCHKDSKWVFEGSSPLGVLKNKKICQYNKNGKLLHTYENIRDAESVFGKYGSINACCNGQQITACGYVWRYQGEKFDKYITEKQWNGTRVCQYTIGGRLLNTFISLRAAYRAVGGTPNRISSVCNGLNNTSGGYVWRYEGDEFCKYEIKSLAKIKRFKPVIKYDLCGNKISSYASISLAALENEVSTSSISRVCKGNAKTSGGYIWRYDNIEE